MNWKRAVLCVAASLMLSLCSCSKTAEDAPSEEEIAATVEVQTATVEQEVIRQITPVSGTLEALPDQDVKISALVPGRIDQVAVVEGDNVVKGQLIARLDDSTLRDQFLQAKAALDNARANEERVSRLFERGIAAGKEKEDAHRDFISAQSAYDTARTQLERARVVSPIAGTVIKRFHGVGEQVDGSGSDPIVEVGQFNPIVLVANLPTSYLAAVHQGQYAEVHTDAFRDKAFPGNVVSILPAVDPVSGSATVRIRIPNPDLQLKGGMFATAGILTDAHNDALYVPSSALVVTNNEPKIFVVGKDSKAEERHVETGWRDGDKVEILKGAQKGDVVVTTGSYGLADGMTVIVKK